MTYILVLERGDDGGWGGMVPDLPGLLILGETREDVIAQAPDVIADYIDAMREVGHPIPEPGGLAVPIAVSAA
jgi:predicted RNase H-like HicB family nuclease